MSRNKSVYYAVALMARLLTPDGYQTSLNGRSVNLASSGVLRTERDKDKNNF